MKIRCESIHHFLPRTTLEVTSGIVGPYAMAGYSDAEWYCILGLRAGEKTGLGQILDPDHGWLLLDVLRRRQGDPRFFFAVPKCLYTLPSFCDGQLDWFLGRENIRIEAVERDMLTDDLAAAAELYPFIKRLQEYPVVLIGPEPLRATESFLHYKRFVPISTPNLHREPGGIDRGQPTHFYTRRHEFVFSVHVPQDWDKNRRLQWILVVNGKAETANGWLQPEWEVDEGVIQMNLGPGGAPPANPPNQYPQVSSGSQDVRAVVGKPVELTLQGSDDGIPKPRKPRPNLTTPPPPQGLRVRWLHYRGAGRATFTPDQSVPVHGTPISESTQAVFDSPGTYIVRAVLFDGLLETPHDITVTVK